MKKVFAAALVLTLAAFTQSAMAAGTCTAGLNHGKLTVSAQNAEPVKILAELEKATGLDFITIGKIPSTPANLEAEAVPLVNLPSLLSSIGLDNISMAFDRSGKRLAVYILPPGDDAAAHMPDNSVPIAAAGFRAPMDVLNQAVPVLVKGKKTVVAGRGKKKRYTAHYVEKEVLLQPAPGITPSQIQKALQSLGLVQAKDSGLEKLGYIKAQIQGNATVDELIPTLRKSPVFAVSEANLVMAAMGQAATGLPWHLEAAGFNEAWQAVSSNNQVIVAVVDTGVETGHPELAGRVLAGANMLDKDSGPSDDNGHGTFMAGIIAANGDGPVTAAYAGARILPVKVLDSRGLGTMEDAAAGIVWAADNGARVINLSFGCYVWSTLLETAVNYAMTKGCVLVAAAGNEGVSNPLYPSALPGVVSVTALGQDGEILAGSNYGTIIDITAPGQAIVSLGLNGAYSTASGTSSAAAAVSGLAALLQAQRPEIPPIFLNEQMARTARDLGEPGIDEIYGAGLIDAAHALAKEVTPFHDVAVTHARVVAPYVHPDNAPQVLVTVFNAGTYPSETCEVELSYFVDDRIKIVIGRKTVNLSTVAEVPFPWDLAKDQDKDFQFEVRVFMDGDEYPANNILQTGNYRVSEQRNGTLRIKHANELPALVHEWFTGEGWELVRRYMGQQARVVHYNDRVPPGESFLITEYFQTPTDTTATATYSASNWSIVDGFPASMVPEFDDHVGERMVYEVGRSLATSNRDTTHVQAKHFLNNLNAPGISYVEHESDDEHWYGVREVTWSGKVKYNGSHVGNITRYLRDVPFSHFYYTYAYEGGRDGDYEYYVETELHADLWPSWMIDGQPEGTEDAYTNNRDYDIYGTSGHTSLNTGDDDLIEGALEEDAMDYATNHDYYNGPDDLGAVDFFNHHFCEWDTYAGGAFNDGLMTTSLSAWTQGNKQYNYAKYLYSQGNKDRAYYFLGHTAHLLEDMGSLPHVHNDQHMSYDAYESIMKTVYKNGSFLTKNRYNRPKARALYTNWHADTPKWELNAYAWGKSASSITGSNSGLFFSKNLPLEIVSINNLYNTGSPINKAFNEFEDLLGGASNAGDIWKSKSHLFRLFYSMGELADDMPSDDEDGDAISQSWGGYDWERDYAAYAYYANVVQPALIEHLAGMYLLFWAETHASVTGRVVDENNDPIAGATVVLNDPAKSGDKAALETATTDAYGNFGIYADVTTPTEMYLDVSAPPIGTSPGVDHTFINTVGFTDVGDIIIGGPDAISLNSVSVDTSGTQAKICWNTSSEIGIAGYAVWRTNLTTGESEQVNADILPAQGNDMWGAQYCHFDNKVEPGQGYAYKIQEIMLDGSAQSAYSDPVEISIPAAAGALLDPALEAPVAVTPSNGATEAALAPLLTIENNQAVTVRWQAATDETFSNAILNLASSTNTETLAVPMLALLPQTQYFWRARFEQEDGRVSPWSAVSAFTTGNDPADLDGDGVPDAQQPPSKTGLPVVLSVQSGQAITLEPMDNVVDVEAFQSVNPASLTQAAPAPVMELAAFRLALTQPGATAKVRMTFARPAAEGAVWYKYDTEGWHDFSDQASWADDRLSVVLTLVDGGIGDADGTANGVIVDPSGFATVNQGADSGGSTAVWAQVQQAPAQNGSEGSSNCFIQTMSR